MEPEDSRILQSLRTWANKAFNDHMMLSNQYITELSTLDEKSADDQSYDFDLQVKVV